MKHSSHLGNSLMAFINDGQYIGREIVEKRRRWFPLFATRQMSSVILDTVAVADLSHHLDVEHRPLV